MPFLHFVTNLKEAEIELGLHTEARMHRGWEDSSLSERGREPGLANGEVVQHHVLHLRSRRLSVISKGGSGDPPHLSSASKSHRSSHFHRLHCLLLARDFAPPAAQKLDSGSDATGSAGEIQSHVLKDERNAYIMTCLHSS